MDAVATRIAPSALALLQNAPSSSSPAADSRGISPAGTASAAPDQNEAVILDLSEQARTVLAQASAGVQPAPSTKSADDLTGLIRFEERFRLMTEYTALQQELAWLSDRTAAYALDKTFGGAAAQQDQSGSDASGQAEVDRYVQRREELMPRFAELTRKLKALPGQES
ncbi:MULTISPECIES: hypothetical protein [unclassified Bosea (in: a-proteobacteria)]|uniref:hypothetical protein n=1 Tax=unclassified Bosea (in: a-proteobacteria) TaxID=2653178 RepID=UPI000F7E5D02|nr:MULTISPECIES: hypothetical protein [unclassified Bosea (in: a-proteobacteria)]